MRRGHKPNVPARTPAQALAARFPWASGVLPEGPPALAHGWVCPNLGTKCHATLKAHCVFYPHVDINGRPILPTKP